MPYHKDFRVITGDSDCNVPTSDTPLTVWSIPQFEQFQKCFSHGLGQLQHHLSLIPRGQASIGSTSLLTSTMISITRAMSVFLQRRLKMTQRLDGLGRVVETESSKTWYAQPDTLWLRKAITDLKAKCDAFIWVVLEICRAKDECRASEGNAMASTAVTDHRAPTPRLRNYNSFSSIGSEAPYLRSSWWRKEQCDSNASSSSLTNPFSDGSSVHSTAAFSTGPSSLNPNSPIDNADQSRKEACLSARDHQHKQQGAESSSDWSDPMFLLPSATC